MSHTITPKSTTTDASKCPLVYVFVGPLVFSLAPIKTPHGSPLIEWRPMLQPFTLPPTSITGALSWHWCETEVPLGTSFWSGDKMGMAISVNWIWSGGFEELSPQEHSSCNMKSPLKLQSYLPEFMIWGGILVLSVNTFMIFNYGLLDKHGHKRHL